MKKSIQLLIALSLIISIFSLTACGSTQEATNEESAAQESSSNSQENTASLPLTIKHELGETAIEKKPERVVIFDYGVLDSLDFIGEDVVGLPKQSLPPFLDKYNDDKYTECRFSKRA